MNKIKIIPADKSVKLPRSFGIPPKNDLINKIIPNKIKSVDGSLIPAPKIKINPAMKSIIPKTLINIFFKPSFYLKICACSSVWIEHRIPNPGVEGSNPFRRILMEVQIFFKCEQSYNNI